jgi:hypothetical protein
MWREEAMPESEQKNPRFCERCDQESRHLIKSMGADNQPHYVCWACQYREEKRVNLKETWRRGGRVRSTGSSA